MTPIVLAPSDLAEALAVLQREGSGARLLAGGTSWMVRRANGLPLPRVLIRLDGVPGLAGIHEGTDGSLDIGALTTLRTIERSPAVGRVQPGLVEAVGAVATTRVRGQVTIAGNLLLDVTAHDPPPMLMVLGAALTVIGPGGQRIVDVSVARNGAPSDRIQHDEIVTAIHIPGSSRRCIARYRSLVPRTHDDYAIAAAAARIVADDAGQIVDARVAIGAGAAIPGRISSIEAMLVRHSIEDRAPAREAGRMVDASLALSEDPRAGARYRRRMVGLQVERAIEAVLDDLRGESTR
jgi:carbon-monoxide dehydrogenase medium subunit